METKKINLDFSKPWNLNDILQCYLVVHAKLCLIEFTKPIQQTRVYFLFQQWRQVSGLVMQEVYEKMVSLLPPARLPSKKLPEPTLMYPGQGGEHKREALPMPWRQWKPSRSGINPLTQNLPELDRLISYIQASVILQYRLKHIDKTLTP